MIKAMTRREKILKYFMNYDTTNPKPKIPFGIIIKLTHRQKNRPML